MCFMDILEYIYGICCTLRINRLAAAMSWITEIRTLPGILYLTFYVIFYFMSIYYQAYRVAIFLFVFGIINVSFPAIFSSFQWAIEERKTRGVESQTISVGFRNTDPDPEAPLLPEAQQRCIISTPASGAVWNTEPLRQQPALLDEDVRDIIYKKMKTTRRPGSETKLTQSSKKEKHLTTLDSQIISTPRRRTRSSYSLDNPQPGPSRGNPCVVKIIPDIQYDAPTDTSESSETNVDEDGQNVHLLSASPFPTTKQGRKTRQNLRLQTAESSISTQSPKKDHNDRQYSRIKKRIGIVDAATEIRQASESPEKSTVDPIITMEYPSRAQISSSKHDSSGSEDRSPSRSSDTGATEKTLSEKGDESPSSSRHSSLEDG